MMKTSDAAVASESARQTVVEAEHVEDGTGLGLEQLLHSARRRKFFDLKSVLLAQVRETV
jgi:hypothetical protein